MRKKGPYPSDLACDTLTKGGTVVHLRPIRPEDGPRLAEFHRHLSPKSVYQRFFFVHPVLNESEVERFTCVDYVDRLALVAEEGGRLVAVGRYERDPETTEAEVAFVVADEDQDLGIGTLLLEHLADAASDRGITTFTATMLFGNRDMLRVFTDSGYSVRTRVENGTVEVYFSIVPDERSLEARARHEAVRCASVTQAFQSAFPARPAGQPSARAPDRPSGPAPDQP